MRRAALPTALLASAISSLAFSLAGGCAHQPPATRPYAAPSAAELLVELAARQKAVSAASARVRATSWLGGERIRATVNMLVARDGHLRFEAEVTLQGTVAALATDGTRFELWDMRKNELDRGPACPDNVASLVRIPLAPAEIAAVLLGDVRLPATASESAASVAWDPTRGADELIVPDRGGGAFHLFFHGVRGQPPSRQLVGVVRTGAHGARLWQTAYDDFESTGGIPLPKLIRFTERNGSFEDGVEIRFKDRTLDPPTPPAAFAITVPPGVPVHDVGCTGDPP